MSEYQYYEFQALDRPLTTTEQTYVRSLSSRVELTSTKAVFTYSHGDFRGEPKDLLSKCFDVMLYMANWGSRQLVFRLPRSLVDNPAVFQPYCLPESISILTTPDYAILDININDEEYRDWIEGEGWLSNLVILRDDLLRGDFRALYLAWLKTAPMEVDEDESDLLEPPVPANLNNLPASLEAFVEFFDIDRDLIAVAAAASASRKENAELLEQWISALSEEERNDFLVRVVRGEPHVGVQLVKRLEELSHRHTLVKSDTPKRTLSELLARSHEQRERYQEQERQAAQQAKVRELEALALKEATLWEEVFRLIALKQSKPYDEAVAYLVNLRDLAEHQGSLKQFESRISQMQKDYSNRPGLLSRLHRIGLLRG